MSSGVHDDARRTFDDRFGISKKRSVQCRVDFRLEALQIDGADNRIARLQCRVVRFRACAKNQFRVPVNSQGLDRGEDDAVPLFTTASVPSIVRNAMVHLFSIVVAKH